MRAPARWSQLLKVLVAMLSMLTVRPYLAAANDSLREMFLSIDFTIVKRVDALTPTVAAALNATLAGRKLTDPVHLDQTTQMWKPSPGDRLVFAGTSSSLCFVYYELGEAKVEHHLVIMTQAENGKANVAEHLVLNEHAWSVPQLKNAIRKGAFTVLTDGPGAQESSGTSTLGGCTPNPGLDPPATNRPRLNPDAFGRYGTSMIPFFQSDNLIWVSTRLVIIVVTSLTVVTGVLVLGRPCTFIGKYVDPMLAGIFAIFLLTVAFICLRGRPWSASSRVYLVTAAIALWLLYMLMPNIDRVPQRAKAAVAMAQMREIGRQIEAGVTPHESLDPWCHPYEIESSPKGYVVISYGQGSNRDILPGHPYPQGPTNSYENDIVFSAGHFTQYPEALVP